MQPRFSISLSRNSKPPSVRICIILVLKRSDDISMLASIGCNVEMYYDIPGPPVLLCNAISSQLMHINAAQI
jgi:hypothetical protein